MKIKIISDGTAAGTKVTTESGEKIALVQSVDIHVDIDSPTATAVIKFAKPDLELTAEVKE